MTETSPETTRQVVQGDDATLPLEQQARMDLVEFLDVHYQDPDMTGSEEITALFQEVIDDCPAFNNIRRDASGLARQVKRRRRAPG